MTGCQVWGLRPKPCRQAAEWGFQKEPDENVWKFDVEKTEICIGSIYLRICIYIYTCFMKFDVLIS